MTNHQDTGGAQIDEREDWERSEAAREDALVKARHEAEVWPIDSATWHLAWNAAVVWAGADIDAMFLDEIICLDCSKKANPGCEYAGHGTITVKDLIAEAGS